jgi:hypothetical protein
VLVGIRTVRERIAEAVHEGVPLDEIETEMIDGAETSPEGRDALWLYAWGLSERGRDRSLSLRSE